MALKENVLLILNIIFGREGIQYLYTPVKLSNVQISPEAQTGNAQKVGLN